MTLPPPHPLDSPVGIAKPAQASERIVAIDVLRGVAILGILLMNIQSFAMPISAYAYPWSWGDMSGINGMVHYAGHVLAFGKFISIFAILFGAGIVLQTSRTSNQNDHIRIHYRRMGGLILFGLAHAYLFWYGDILFSYGMIGMLVFLLRNLAIRYLLIIAATTFACGLILNVLMGLGLYALSANESYGIAEQIAPSMDKLLKEVANYRGTWLEQMRERLPIAVLSQTFLLAIYTLPFVAPLMLVGMALMKSGFFAGDWPRQRMIAVMVGGISLGWGLSVLGLWLDARTGRNPVLSAQVWTHFNTLAMLPTALGYSAAVMLLARSSVAARLAPLAAVGRTALSCYLLETIICTTIFYGHGFGWFGSVDRIGQWGIVLGVWVAVIAFATFWTRHFRYGPAEWVWRGMTYGFSRV